MRIFSVAVAMNTEQRKAAVGSFQKEVVSRLLFLDWLHHHTDKQVLSAAQEQNLFLWM
jgi:hypothetical protein